MEYGTSTVLRPYLGYTLLTGAPPVQHWGLTLPDLVSRMRGTTAVALDAPDDTLLSALLVKLLADRQLSPKPDMIPYLLSRMDRSFAAAIAMSGVWMPPVWPRSAR